jgi:hypothetical protein
MSRPRPVGIRVLGAAGRWRRATRAGLGRPWAMSEDGRVAYDLTGLGPYRFQEMCQALALDLLGVQVRAFGDGPDGGRDATFTGRLRYPTPDEPWDGDGVLQVKYRQRLLDTSADRRWLRAEGYVSVRPRGSR